MGNGIEEIFWKEEKFVKANGEEVHPKPIGEPIVIQFYDRYPDFNIKERDAKIKKLEERRFKRIKEAALARKANAYCTNVGPTASEFPYQFYKI
jgi:hypothetical protein